MSEDMMQMAERIIEHRYQVGEISADGYATAMEDLTLARGQR